MMVMEVKLMCWIRFEYIRLLYTKYFSHILIPLPFTMITFMQVFFDNHLKENYLEIKAMLNI